MRRAITILASTMALLCCTEAIGASWDTVVFRDDFDVDGMPDPQEWWVNDPECLSPECEMSRLGRTHFPHPSQWTDDGKFPVVEDGSLVIRHHLWDPYDDANDPNIFFLGGYVESKRKFEPSRSYLFEAKVRWNVESPYVPYPNGLVNSFFLYTDRELSSGDIINDEIDAEFSSNGANGDGGTFPDGDPVVTNSYNDELSSTEWIEADGLDLTEWNTFRIYWFPAGSLPDPDECRIEWSWVGSSDGESWLRAQTDCSVIPDEAMAVFFNFWAPCYTGWREWCFAWDGAADPDLQPVDDEESNEVSAYEVDYVEVRVSSHDVPALSKWNLIAMGAMLVGVGAGIIHRRQREEQLANR